MGDAAAASTSWAESLLDQTSAWTLPVCLLVSCWMYVMPAVRKVMKIGKQPSKMVEGLPTSPQSASGGTLMGKAS